MSFLRFVDSRRMASTSTSSTTRTTTAPTQRSVQIADNLSRTEPHDVKIVLDLYTGAHNDVANVFIDGNGPLVPIDGDRLRRLLRAGRPPGHAEQVEGRTVGPDEVEDRIGHAGDDLGGLLPVPGESNAASPTMDTRRSTRSSSRLVTSGGTASSHARRRLPVRQRQADERGRRLRCRPTGTPVTRRSTRIADLHGEDRSTAPTAMTSTRSSRSLRLVQAT